MDKDKLSESMTFAMVKGELQIVDGMWVDSLLSYDVKAKPVIIDGKYKILEIIGQGGMGTVYKAEQIKLGRSVALKTFRSKEIPADVWRRFEREARAVAQLNHENIIKVYDFGITEDNRPFYTMELLSGESLEERLDRHGALSLPEFYYIFARVIEALKYTHEKNIVHRDIKPANVFLTLKDEQITGVKLVDFGIAGLVTDMGTADQRLTDTGTIFGSPLYMSPEQSRGENLDGRTDIYSCGCMLFECLTEGPPFRGKSALETIIMHQSTAVPPLPAKTERGEKIPDWLSQLYGLMMQKEKDNRIGSCAEIFDVMSFQLKDAKMPTNTSTENIKIEKEAHSGKTTPSYSSNAKTKIITVFAVIISGLGVIAWSLLKPASVAHKKNPESLVPAVDSKPQENSVTAPENLGNEPFAVRAGKGEKAFLFPKTAIGALEVFGVNDAVPAQGRLAYKKSDFLIFTADSSWPEDPKLWRGFGPGDLVGVELRRPVTIEHIKEICKMPTLARVFIEDSDIGPNLIDEINKLKPLVSLKLHDGKLDTADYVRLKRLPYLRELYIYDCKNITPILKLMLTKEPEVRLLNVTGCTIKEEDISLIAQLRNLTSLDLTNTTVTGMQLARVAGLKYLDTLFVNGAKVVPSDAKYIALFKGLRFLKVGPSWTLKDQEAVRSYFAPGQLKVSTPIPESSKDGIETYVKFDPEKL